MNSSNLIHTAAAVSDLIGYCTDEPARQKLEEVLLFLLRRAVSGSEAASPLARVSDLQTGEAAAPPAELPASLAPPTSPIQMPDQQQQVQTIAESVAPTRTQGGGTRRTLSEFCEEMNLPTGHTLHVMGTGGRLEKDFRLSFKANKATLTTSFADGSIITGSNPTSVVKAYFKKTKGYEVACSGWDKLMMKNPDGGYWPIGSHKWTPYCWNTETGRFESM